MIIRKHGHIVEWRYKLRWYSPKTWSRDWMIGGTKIKDIRKGNIEINLGIPSWIQTMELEQLRRESHGQGRHDRQRQR